MSVVNVWVGATTPAGARVVAKVDSGASVRVGVDTDPGLANPTFHGPVTPTAQGVASVELTGLAPNTAYRLAVEHDGVLAPRGLVLPGVDGSYATTGHHASLTITGDLDLRAEVTIADWGNAAPDGTRATFLGKWDSGQRSYFLGVEDDGRPALFWSTTGSDSALRFSTAAVPAASGRLAVRATLDADNGSGGHDVTFYTGPSLAGPWTQLGSTVTNSGTVTVFSGTAEASVGAVDGGSGRPMAGTIHAVEFRDGIDGDVVADPDFEAQPPGSISLVDGGDLVWNLQGLAETSLGVGGFRTHPPVGQPASFTFGSASCAGSSPATTGVGDVLVPGRISNDAIFDTVRRRAQVEGWLFFSHLGDICYYDPGRDPGRGDIPSGADGATVGIYRQLYDDVLAQPRQHGLYRTVPLVYAWDDHDYGPNDSDRTHVGQANAAQVFRERVPHYPLPSDGPIFHHFEIGRVLFVVADVRHDRDPNSDSQTSAKGILGPGQRLWMEQVLSTSDAELLIWLCAERAWHWPQTSGAGDHWGAFPQERDELVAMFDQLGWSDRMLIINGDSHHNGFNSGSHAFGGMPVYQFAALDSSATDPMPGGLWDVTATNQRHQYGTVSVVDSGSSITVTGTAYIQNTPVGSHTFTVQVQEPPPPPPEPPPPAPAPVGRARIRRSVTWLGVHAVTGRIIAELPDVRGEVGRLLSAYQSASLTLPIPLDGPGHVPIRLVEQAVEPINSAIVAVVNDLPVWMGWVVHDLGGTDAEMRLAVVTPEGYLRRRKVRDHTFTGVDRALIASELLGDAGPMSGVGAGLGFDVDVTLTGDLIDREYLASDRQWVYDALRELAADGMEFAVDLDWLDEDRTSVRKIVRVGPRLGKVESDVLFETSASSLFEARAGSEATYQYSRDRSDGRYANWIQAYGPGEGEDQPASVPAVDQAALDAGAPIVEHHWQPSTTISEQGDLDRHASAELARLRRGAELWQIEARWDAYPRLGVDAQIGDDVSWLLHGHRHPDGVMGRGRMVGWRLDMQAGTWRPILLDPQEA